MKFCFISIYYGTFGFFDISILLCLAFVRLLLFSFINFFALFFFNLFFSLPLKKIYLSLAELGLHCHEGFSLVEGGRGVQCLVFRLLIAVASTVVDHGLRASGLS